MRDAAQCFYDATIFDRHIECLWDGDYLMRTIPPSEIRTSRDPGWSPDLPAVVADLRRAWAKTDLDATERQVFVCRQFWHLSITTIAQVYELDEAEVAAVLDGATERLLDFLNGVRR